MQEIQYETILKTNTLIKFITNKDQHLDFADKKYTNYLIVSEQTVINKYKHYIEKMQYNTSRNFELFLINEGDFYKTNEAVDNIIKYMLSKNLDKSACIIGLGGGKITDLVGYITSIYLRGIDNILIPTTLLSMVDASVGGKTGINDTFYGKNLIGTIYQPNLIVINTWMIEEMPNELISDGLAEIIKIFALFDSLMFEKLICRNLKTLMADGELVNEICRKAIEYKVKVIQLDDRDKGLRNCLNFGHTLGHAIESVEAFNLSHGKSVSIGLVLEVELACNMGLTKKYTLYKIKECLENYNLPTDIPEYIDTFSIIEKIKNDKKNSNNKPKIVVIKEIGVMYHDKVTVSLEFSDISNFLSKKVLIENLDYNKSSQVINLPGSKSICNRALILSALGSGEICLKNFLFAEDTNIMIKCLKQIGVNIDIIDESTVKVKGVNGQLENIETSLFVENAGTAARFLVSLSAICKNSRITINGNSRMRERPIDDLLEVFTDNTNIKIEFVNNDNKMPFRIVTGEPFQGGELKIKSKKSSQFISSLLLSSALFGEDTLINLTDIDENEQPVSYQYIDMTIKMLEEWGVHVKMLGYNRYYIKKGHIVNPSTYYIEPDASTANFYLMFIALHGGEIVLNGLGNKSIQGDSKFVEFLAKIDNQRFIVEQSDSATKLKVCENFYNKIICFKENLSIITDSFLSLGCIYSQIPGEYTFTGLANQAVKECNRLELFCLNMNRIGVFCHPHGDGIYIDSRNPRKSNLNFVKITTANDHRMAMSFSILGSYLKNTKLIIDNKKCVNKTFPEFWLEFSKFGLTFTPDQFDQNKSIYNFYNKNYLNSPVFLIGMRSCGKTTFGKIAGEKLGLNFLDLDDFILVKNPEFKTIPEIIEKLDWKGFREMEIRIFKEIISESYKYAGYIIACGGGVVENDELLNCIKSQELVVFIDTHIDNIKKVTELKEHKTTKPKFQNSIDEVYAARLDKYKYCSGYVFKTPYLNDNDFSNYDNMVGKIADLFTEFIYLSCGSMRYPLPTENSYFVCVLYEEKILAKYLNFENYDAVEFRADLFIQNLLKGKFDEDYIVNEIIKAISLLRYYNESKNYIPVIFTIRSIQEGGYFSGTLKQYNGIMFKLLKYGIEYFDVEFNYDNLTFIEHFRSICNNSRIILSKHYIENIPTDTIKKDIYTMSLFNVDIIKIITNVADAHKYLEIKNFLNMTIKKPLIHFQLGENNKLTRIHNNFLTPVYDSNINEATGTGQMTLNEVVAIKALLNTPDTRVKNYYVLGSNVSGSLSPEIYNAAFNYYAIDNYKYNKGSCDEEQLLNLLIKQDTAIASITIPYKGFLFNSLNNNFTFSEEAKFMKAINTVKKINNNFYCFNTDWIGSYEIILEIIKNIDKPLSEIKVVILGAGGAAASILFSLMLINIPKTGVYLLNRTKGKDDLVKKFKIENCDIPGQIFYDIVISTIPASADFDFLKIVEKHISKNTFCVDLAYCIKDEKFEDTNFKAITSKISNKYINGIEFLLRQAFYSFEIFTGKRCPRNYIREIISSKLKI
jgi:pentafunctional AROM polypeptide